MHKLSFLNVFKSLQSANQNKQEAEFDLSSVEFPIIDATICYSGRRRHARTGTKLANKASASGTDFSKNKYQVVREETRNMKNEVIDSYYFVYRVYSTGGMKRITNKAEIDWAVSRTFNQ